jgi:hypothetical protein
MMKRDWFIEGIEQLPQLAADADAKRPTAILCGEEDPAHCHREHLIAAYLRRHHPGIGILHIWGNGTLTSLESLLL